MNILTTAATLATINARLTHPISRALFEQSIRPLMLQRGDAQIVGGTTWIFDGEWIGAWCDYLVWRERQIADGKLPARSAYSISDMEALFHGQIEKEQLA